jgi:hypothetical protein
VSDRSSVYLKNRVNGQLIEAFLIDGVTLAEVQRVESSWRPIVEKSQAPVEHSHWDWRKKHEAVAGLIAYRMFGVECDDEMQGLMLVSTAGHACRIPSQRGKELVYVNFVATAPWNSAAVVQTPRYSLVGRVFVATAIQLSREEGFRGRIGLHSLPQAESFYAESCGMTDLGIDRKKENLRYFEMTPEQTEAYLR